MGSEGANKESGRHCIILIRRFPRRSSKLRSLKVCLMVTDLLSWPVGKKKIGQDSWCQHFLKGVKEFQNDYIKGVTRFPKRYLLEWQTDILRI